ncbi:MAG TPA: cation-efflux pump, partial [Kurthia sp.]
LVVRGDYTIEESTVLLKEIEHQLAHESIQHVTIQLEAASQIHGDDLLCNAEAEFDPHAGHNH